MVMKEGLERVHEGMGVVCRFTGKVYLNNS